MSQANKSKASENPESSLAAGPPAFFASRYSDPNHPANSGSIIALITDGVVNPHGLREDRRVKRAVWMGQELTGKTRQRNGGGKGMVKRMLKKVCFI